MQLFSAKTKENALRISPEEPFSHSFAKVTSDVARSDEDMLRGIARGNELALTELFHRYAGMLCGIAFRILRDADASDDAVQSAFAALWRSAGALVAAKTPVAGWLALTTRELALAVLHQKRRPPQTSTGITFRSDAGLDLASMIEGARQVMRALPKTSRAAVETAFFDGLAPEEIAQATFTSTSEVSAELRSTLLRLRRAVQE